MRAVGNKPRARWKEEAPMRVGMLGTVDHIDLFAPEAALAAFASAEKGGCRVKLG